MFPSLLAAAEPAPAGGAETTQIVIATVGALVVTAVLLGLCAGHRSGRTAVLERAGGFAGKLLGLPGWAALPAVVGNVALVTALFGMYWDISLHIDNGRDAGPLANPAHYFILFGLFGIFAAGVLAVAMPAKGSRPGPSAVRIAPGWHAPVGGLLFTFAGAFALTGFPLDDVWHRLFGQDVTLWGPTHLMLVGGAALTLIGFAVLVAEGHAALRLERAASGEPATARPAGRVAGLVHRGFTIFLRAGVMGGTLIGVSVFLAEFDFGVAQYRGVFQPFLIALAASFALVGARLWIGAGGAIAACLFGLVNRAPIHWLVGEPLGQSFPSLPLFLGAAIVIELAALAIRHRPLLLGAVAGLLAGTLGVLAEWPWVNATFELQWNASWLFPEGLLMSAAIGVAGGLCGALLICGLRGELPRPAVARGIPAAAAAVFVLCLANGLATSSPDGRTVQVALQPTGPGEARVTARFDPPVPADAEWVNATAWQGGGLEVAPLERGADGTWRSTDSVPVGGDWKTLLRVHEGRSLGGTPIFLPGDPAIPAPEVAPGQQFTARLQDDKTILQRERDFDVPGWLWGAAVATVGLFFAMFYIAMCWGVGRYARGVARQGSSTTPPAAAPPAPRRAPDRKAVPVGARG